jgi:site-specific recombinase XerD
MKVNFYLRPSKISLKSIQMYISFAGQREPMYTLCRVEEKMWDSKKQRVSLDFKKEAGQINPTLFDLEAKARKLFEDCNPATPKALKELMTSPEPTDTRDIWEVYEEYIKDGQTRISEVTDKVLSKGTLKNYQKSLNRLKAFSEKHWPGLTFKDFGLEFESKYRDYHLDELKVDPLTYGDYIKQLKAFLAWCRARKIKVNKAYKKFYRPRKQKIPKALRKEELITLYDLNLKSDPILERDLLIFLFMCSSAMRKSDYDGFDPSKHIEVMTIQEREVKYINIGAIKNAQECIVPYFDSLYFRPVYLVETMLQKYGKLPKIKDGVKFNSHLKEIFELAGITRVEPTSKMGRKTYSSVYRKLGMNREMIKKITGHRDDKSLDHYIGIEPSDILEEAINKAVYVQAS